MNCGCCSCLTADPGMATPNRPGLSAIARRIGTHASLYDRMIARLSALDPLAGRAGALAGLTTREKNDPSIAFLDAWATCADVLTFYQERLANEGYLRTATERRSIVELGRLVGYTLQPGVSASSYAAYFVDDKATTLIPAGAKVQSAPILPGEEPQVFETAEELEARGEWNLLVPRKTRPRVITLTTLRQSDFRLYIEGSEHSLSPGDALLFLFQAGEFAVGWIRDVEVDRAANRTSVRLHRLVTASRKPADTAPDVQPAGVFTQDFEEKLEITQESILQDPSVPPATSFDLGTAYEDRFRKNSDFQFRIAGELVPGLRKLPVLEANRQRKNDPELSGLWVLRNRSALFGYNAPDQVPTLSGQLNDANVEFLPPTPDANSEKPERVFLEVPDDGIAFDSWVVLMKGTKVLVRKVRDAATMPRAAYGISGKTTRLDLDLAWWDALPFSDIRNTVVLARSEPLTVAWEPIAEPVGARREQAETSAAATTIEQKKQWVVVKGKTVALDRLASGLTPGRWVIFSGERADLPGVQSAELAMIAAVEHHGLDDELAPVFSDIIVAGEGLAYSYRRDTLKIYGNVVKITHGETFAEILGNGDATQRLQTFLLRHAPLTWVAAANPTGIATTLQVRVHDVLAREVTSLALAGPADRVYVTKTGDDGRTRVTFGSGERGARLPTGSDNVRAVYRKGLGRAGNVLAGQINVPLTRVVGMREVTNPIEASGGSDPEPRDRARANLPLAVRALGRVVSVRDYEEFARTFAGIAKAMVAIVPQRRDTILLTIAGDGEMEVLETSDLFRALVEALRRYGNPLQPLRVVNREKVLITGLARVQVHRDYEWKGVAPKIRASLLDTFSFERRALLQPVFPSEVVAAIQRVEGVAWVDLDRLAGIRSDNVRANPGAGFGGAAGVNAIVPPESTLENGIWYGAGLAYLPASLIDAFILQEVPHA
jgi:predicted phage baseplate assembly protein